MIYHLSEGLLNGCVAILRGGDFWKGGERGREREREDLGIWFCFFLELIFEDCSSSQLSSNHNFFDFCFLSFDQ